LNEAFNEKEQAIIQTTNVPAEANPQYSSDPGNDTKDKVFLLSISEVEKYFASDEERRCKPTEYAIEQKGWAWEEDDVFCWWWMRSPGNEQFRATLVQDDGSIDYHGYTTDIDWDCVRPAMWVTVN